MLHDSVKIGGVRTQLSRPLADLLGKPASPCHDSILSRNRASGKRGAVQAVGSWERLLRGVPQGRRNDSLARLVGKMLAEGMPAEFARLAAHEFGRRCNPPMDPNELERTFESILSRERRKTGRRPALINLADVEAEEVEYLWPPYLPRRKLTLIEGDPGVGKTWLALAITAAVTSGRQPGPDGQPGEPREPANVLYLTAEDGLADTLRPRLDTMGADVERVTVLEGVRGRDGKLDEFTLQKDSEMLEAALAEVKPAFVVIDPIQGFLGSIDMHRANEVRPLLAGLGRLADRHGCAVAAIRHLRKSPSDKAIYRGLGSIDFTAAVRSVLLVGSDPQDSNRSVVAHAKANLSKLGPSLAFEIRDGNFSWLGTSSLEAVDLASSVDTPRQRPRDSATDFLKETLADGPRLVSELKQEAESAGVSWRTVERAKGNLEVKAQRRGFGPGGIWEGAFPKDRQTAN